MLLLLQRYVRYAYVTHAMHPFLGQDSLMCGQIVAAASGLISAPRGHGCNGCNDLISAPQPRPPAPALVAYSYVACVTYAGALRILGPLRTLQFCVRALRLLLPPLLSPSRPKAD